MSKIIIVVENGFIQEVFSSRKNVDVEIIDLDSDCRSEEEQKEIEKQVDKIRNMKLMKSVY